MRATVFKVVGKREREGLQNRNLRRLWKEDATKDKKLPNNSNRYAMFHLTRTLLRRTPTYYLLVIWNLPSFLSSPLVPWNYPSTRFYERWKKKHNRKESKNKNKKNPPMLTGNRLYISIWFHFGDDQSFSEAIKIPSVFFFPRLAIHQPIFLFSFNT